MRTYLTAVILGFAAATFGSGAGAAPLLPPQSATASGVTVKVTPQSLSGKFWEFEIVFDTHSQELKDDLMKTAVLLAEEGAAAAPVEWKGDPAGGHHRKGLLRFNAVTPAPAVLELRILRPGEPSPRVFRWKLR